MRPAMVQPGWRGSGRDKPGRTTMPTVDGPVGTARPERQTPSEPSGPHRLGLGRLIRAAVAGLAGGLAFAGLLLLLVRPGAKGWALLADAARTSGVLLAAGAAAVAVVLLLRAAVQSRLGFARHGRLGFARHRRPGLARHRRLSLIHKAAVLSLLVHIGLTALFSAVFLSRPLLHRLAEAAGLTTSVNLELAREVEMRMQIRGQITDVPVTELPVVDPALAEPTRLAVAAIPREPPPRPSDPPLPATEVRPADLPPPVARPAQPALAPAEPLRAILPPEAESPRVRLSPPPAIARAESPPPAPQEPPPVAAVPPEEPPPPAGPREMVAPAVPDLGELSRAARPAAESLAAMPAAEPARAPEPPREMPRATAQTGLNLAAPQVTVAAAGPAPRRPGPPPALPPEPGEVEVLVSGPRRIERLSPHRLGELAGSAPPASPTGLSSARSLLAAALAPPAARLRADAGLRRTGADSPPSEAVRAVAAISPLEVPLGPGRLASPDPYFQRSVDQREKYTRAMGGSKESEDSVTRALAYLAGVQQPDGHWPMISGKDDRPRRAHSAALTGLALLCFLAADHTHARDGPYRACIRRGLDYLVAGQQPDGDTRCGGDMYDQAIAVLALGEAGTMTGDPICRAAAIKGAIFILNAQNPSTGGWRYKPREDSDTSVFGWQIMALHSVERLGVRMPAESRRGAMNWLARVSRSRHGMLAGYQQAQPTVSMTAEAVFSRIMLAQRLTAEQVQEVGDYLKPPQAREEPNFYYWYYGSLALMQLGGEAWERWNPPVRDALIRFQERDGGWATERTRWGAQGGRIYATALAALTLEVYYRYLPMYGLEVPHAGPDAEEEHEPADRR